MHADHLGSPVAATDQSGAILWAEQFSPYGESIPGSAANPDDEGFTGHIQDTGTGLTYMQARDYDPVIGRFLSNDPVGFAEGGVQYFNRYAYTVNDPVNNIDPTGNYRCANEDCSMANIERNPSQEGIPPISSEIEGAGNFDLGATITHQRHQTSKPGSSRRMKITRTPDLTIAQDRDALLTFYDFPAQHWQSIRTSNPIESAFATIRHRTKRTKGCLSRDGMLHMMFKLGQCAEKSWRRLRGFAHLAEIIQGVDFINGIKPANQDQAAA